MTISPSGDLFNQLNILSFTGLQSNYNFRLHSLNLSVPKPLTESLRRSVSYFGATSWHNLPNQLKMIHDFIVFKILHLKQS